MIDWCTTFPPTCNRIYAIVRSKFDYYENCYVYIEIPMIRSQTIANNNKIDIWIACDGTRFSYATQDILCWIPLPDNFVLEGVT